MALIDEIVEPAATTLVQWLTAGQGGRLSGPPTARVYAANCTFPLGGERELVPGWPATGEMYSLLLQKRTELPNGAWLCYADFLALDLVAEYLRPGAQMIVMEGPKVVGYGRIQEVIKKDLGPANSRQPAPS